MKKILPFVLALIIVSAGAFYGGTLYAKSKNSVRNNPSTVSSGQSNRFTRDGGANFSNLSPEERQARFGQMGRPDGAGGARDARDGGGGFVSGEIISKDDKSVTIKLSDSGSKIIFFSDSTKITKTVDGAPNDLKAGGNITVSGDVNFDGSVTAKTIQLRPSLPNPGVK